MPTVYDSGTNSASYTGPTLDNPTFTLNGNYGTSTLTSSAGLTSYGVTTDSTVIRTDSGATAAYNYTIVVQIPVPFLNLSLNLNLLGDFVLPALTALGIPEATLWLTSNIVKRVQNIVNDAIKLVQAIPELTVSIVIKIGFVIVLNIQLVAKKTPVVVDVPTFQLELPNIAVGADYTVTIPFPAPPPIMVKVPIPVPVINFPQTQLSDFVTGGNITANVQGTVQAEPQPITDPIYLPKT
jgi:hypothetical protein